MSSIGIIINNYNYARFLPACIDSALAQSRPADEIIVVDDGSTDESAEILASYADRVACLRQDNQGQAAAMNSGYAASRSDLLLFLDADDYLYPDALETCSSAWRDGASKLHFRLDRVDRDGALIGETWPKRSQALPEGDIAELASRAGRFPFPPTSGNLFARRALERIMPIPPERFRLCADAYLIIRSIAFGPQVAVDRSLGAYRIHGSNAYFEKQRYLDPRRARLHYESLMNVRALVDEAIRDSGRPAYKGRLHYTEYATIILAKRLFGDGLHPQSPIRALHRDYAASLASLPVSPRKRAFLRLYGLTISTAPLSALRFVGRAAERIFPRWFANQ